MKIRSKKNASGLTTFCPVTLPFTTGHNLRSFEEIWFKEDAVGILAVNIQFHKFDLGQFNALTNAPCNPIIIRYALLTFIRCENTFQKTKEITNLIYPLNFD